MAVLKSGYVALDDEDITQYVREIHTPEQYNPVDASGLTSDGAMEWEDGMYSADFTIVCKSAYGAAALNAIVRDLFDARDDFELKINPFPLPTTTDNPQVQATVRLFTKAEVDAAIGNLITTSIQLKVQGKAAIVTT